MLPLLQQEDWTAISSCPFMRAGMAPSSKTASCGVLYISLDSPKKRKANFDLSFSYLQRARKQPRSPGKGQRNTNLSPLANMLAQADTSTEQAPVGGKAMGLHPSPVAQRSKLGEDGYEACREEDSILVFSKWQTLLEERKEADTSVLSHSSSRGRQSSVKDGLREEQTSLSQR